MTTNNNPKLQQLRDRLNTSRGKEYWRCLEELADSEGFQEMLQREFPRQANVWDEGLSRRKFLGLIGASLALAGLSGCTTAPRERILPYVRQPEEIVPGNALYFATAMPLAGFGSGLLVKSLMGRPNKIEGNPDHPANLKPDNAPTAAPHGPTDAFAQAAMLTMYDPDRSQAVTRLGHINSWDRFVEEIESRLRERPGGAVNRNLRIRLLTETVTGPALAHQIRMVLQRFPQAKWHVYEPAGRDNARIAARHAFGENVEVRYDFTRADVVLSLDANFLGSGPGHVRNARDFSSRRRFQTGGPNRMNRLYALESMPTITGATADHRLPIKSAAVESFARALANALGVEVANNGNGPAHSVPRAWLQALAADLRSHRGTCLVLASEGQPPLVHALAHAINHALGNAGQTVFYTDVVEYRPPDDAGDNPVSSLQHLVADMEAGNVDLLLIVGGNPVYTAPVDFRFTERMQRVPLRVHLSLYDDETSEQCHWHIPKTHFLESWGDVAAFDGTVSIIQPLIAPLYGGKSNHEVLALLSGQTERSGHDVVMSYWRRVFENGAEQAEGERAWNLTEQINRNAGNFDNWWQRVLHDGLMRGTAAATRQVQLQENWLQAPGVAAGAREGLEIVFKPDPSIFDGRFANNGWLQELPKPLTKITWDNAAYVSPATAVQLGYAAASNPEQANGKIVTLRYRDHSVDAPLWVVPAHADDSVTVHMGYGRRRAGQVGTGIGFDAYRLRTSQALWLDGGLELRDARRTMTLASTQSHFLIEDPEHHLHNRHLIYPGTPQHPPHIHREEEPVNGRNPLSLYAADHPYTEGNQWGMCVDLSSCTGCGACLVACQSENNIPVVGKEQVALGREMHWIRIDTYYQGPAENPKTYVQPVACIQCQNAPCELVCPVEATVHSHDGLNDMVYNRCVGTRYCSNNCPYKVRRFNFLQYSDYETESLHSLYNPEVTVRTRGVMEKCTYCVQRIRTGQIVAEREGRDLRDGEIVTACQSVCPSGAIVFGDINTQSQAKRMKESSLNYVLLPHQNTLPRTSYLATIRNPNPALTDEEH